MANVSINKKSALTYIVALTLVGCGVNLFLIGNLGSDPLTVLQEGIHIYLNISVGMASFLYNVFVILCAAFVNRKQLKCGTILYSVLIGLFIDFFSWCIPSVSSPILRLIYFTIGQICIAYGFATLIRCGFGMTALDILIFKLSDFTAVKYKHIRWITDTTLVIVGWLFGGTVGVGTIISVITTAYLIEYFSKLHLDK